MIEDLEEEEQPSMNHGFINTWLTRRRTWDDKARALKILPPLSSLVDPKLHAFASDFYTPLSKSRLYIFRKSVSIL